MKEIKAIIQPGTLDAVIHALKQIPDLPGITVSEVRGFGRNRAVDATPTVMEGANEFGIKVKLEVVVPDEMLELAIQAIQANAHRGKPGDGKIFVYTVNEVINLRTGDRGEHAI